MKKDFSELMELIPEQFIEEAAAYRQAHLPAARIAPRIKLFVPLSAAACAVIAVGGILLSRSKVPENDQFAYDSTPKQVTEIQPEQTKVTTASTTAKTTETAIRTTVITKKTSVRTQTSAKQMTAETATQTAAQPVQKQNAASGGNETRTEITQPPAAETQPAETKPDILSLYRLGDVNMDGCVTVGDAQILSQEYSNVVLKGGESTLTPEQLILGDVTDEWDPSAWPGTVVRTPVVETDYPISAADVILLLRYYTECMVGDLYRWYPVEMYRDAERQFWQMPLIQIQDRYSFNLLNNDNSDVTDPNVPVDLETDTLNIDGFAAFPLHFGAEHEWMLTKVRYYDPAQNPELPFYDTKYYTANYRFILDASDPAKQYKYADFTVYEIKGGADRLFEKIAATEESFRVFELNGKTVAYDMDAAGETANTIYGRGRRVLYWTEGDYLCVAAYGLNRRGDENVDLSDYESVAAMLMSLPIPQ